MKKATTKKLVSCALFTALTTLSTLVIQIPIGVSGYINLGDVFVILGALVLGITFGSISAGVGCMIADVLTPYAIYAPGSLIIKGVTAILISLIFKALKGKIKGDVVAPIIASIVGELFMVLGYFFYESVVLSYGLSATANIPFNLIQGGVGITVAMIILVTLSKTGVAKKLNKIVNEKDEG